MGDRLGAGRHDVPGLDGRPADAHEAEVRPRTGRGPAVLEERHGVDHGDRVEPVPDPPAPQDDPVLGLDPRPDAADRRARALRRLCGHAERDDVDQRPHRAVALVVGDVEQALAGHQAEPEVALLLAGADDVVGGGAVRDRRVIDHRLQAPAAGLGTIAHALEDLHHRRVVEVGDEARTQTARVSTAAAAGAAGRRRRRPPATASSRGA